MTQKKKIEDERKKWEARIAAKDPISVKMNNDGSIDVDWIFKVSLNENTRSGRQAFVIKSEDPMAKAFLRFTGPLNPGDTCNFHNPFELRTSEASFSLSSLEDSFTKIEFYKAVMVESDQIELYLDSNSEDKFTFSNEEYLNLIQKHTGPMNPGDVFHFKKD